MTRPLRLEFPGAVYHVTSRGNGRAAIYLDDGDREAFLNILGDACRRMHWVCYAYCLMTNHYHLVIETLNPHLSRSMRQLNGVYTQCFNRHHGRVGHVFQGRYKAILVDREPYLLELVRYVVLNPIRANMVTSPEQWRWSSYHATAGQGHTPDWLATDWVLRQFGTRRTHAHARFAQFVRDGQTQPSIWDGLRNQIYLGDEQFVHGCSPKSTMRNPWTKFQRCKDVCAACRWRTLHGSMATSGQPWQRPICQERIR